MNEPDLKATDLRHKQLMAEWYQELDAETKKKRAAKSLEWYRTNRARALEVKSKRRKYNKEKIYELLGNKCAFCGATHNLQIDHKKNDGRSDLRPCGTRFHGETMVWKLLRIGDPTKEYQLLCKSCNINKHQRAPEVLTKALLERGMTIEEINALLKSALVEVK